jgi:NTE family protein
VHGPTKEAAESEVRIGLVLSGGGLRGAGHLGVLQQLLEHDVRIDIIVGSSAGAIVAAYYAAVGLTIDELLADAERFCGRHLVAHALNVRPGRRLDRVLAPLSGIVPTRLEQLKRADFERLHHGVRGIGVVCHDVTTGMPCYFSTDGDQRAELYDVVRASASMPLLFAPVPVACGDGQLLLTDGGVSDSLPVEFARRPPLSATHVIVSDCRMVPVRPPATTDRLVYVRPRLATTSTLRAPSASLRTAVREGAAAITDEVLDRIGRWVVREELAEPA